MVSCVKKRFSTLTPNSPFTNHYKNLAHIYLPAYLCTWQQEILALLKANSLSII